MLPACGASSPSRGLGGVREAQEFRRAGHVSFVNVSFVVSPFLLPLFRMENSFFPPESSAKGHRYFLSEDQCRQSRAVFSIFSLLKARAPSDLSLSVRSGRARNLWTATKQVLKARIWKRISVPPITFCTEIPKIALPGPISAFPNSKIHISICFTNLFARAFFQVVLGARIAQAIFAREVKWKVEGGK